MRLKTKTLIIATMTILAWGIFIVTHISWLQIPMGFGIGWFFGSALAEQLYE